jgi:hypothetical protein
MWRELVKFIPARLRKIPVMPIVGSTSSGRSESMLTVAAIELSVAIVTAARSDGNDCADCRASVQTLLRLYYAKNSVVRL